MGMPVGMPIFHLYYSSSQETKGAGCSLTLCQSKEKFGLKNTSNDTRNLQTTFFVPLTSELDGSMVFVMVH